MPKSAAHAPRRPDAPKIPSEGTLSAIEGLGVLLGVDDVGVVEGHLLGAEEHVVHALHAQHERVVLVGHLVLVAAEAPAAPHVVLPQEGEGLGEDGVAPHGGGGVAVLQPPVVDRHDLAVGSHELRGDGPQHGLLDDLRPRPPGALEGHRVLLHGLPALGLRHLEHERPVGPPGGLLRARGRRLAVTAAQRGQLLGRLGDVVIGVVREDRGAVEGAVVLGVVEPALGVMRVLTADAETDDVAAGEEEAVGEVLLAHVVEGDVQGDGGDQGPELDLAPVLEGHLLLLQVDADHGVALPELHALLGEEVGHALPDGACAARLREAEHGVGPPPGVLLALDHVVDCLVHIHRGHALAQPVALHLRHRERPHLEVVRAHEDVRDALAHYAHDPLVEVLGLAGGGGVGHLCIHDALQAGDLVLLGEGGDVVLERVRHPRVLHPHIGDALVGVPAYVLLDRSVDELVEVLVVGEDDVPPHVEQEPLGGDVCAGEAPGLGRLIDELPVLVAELVEASGRTEPGGPGPDDEHPNLLYRHLVAMTWVAP
mmetsp:Transcript_19396/g.61731  ORF Transcript_19396/g.61731 Transcript_19396/m.61731 type:complete len:540 (+) Transcript_19396:304-1923(+)